MEYQYVIVPTGFTKDTWVQDVEAAPTDRSVVHHIVAYVRRPGSNYFKGQPTETFFEAPKAKTDEKAQKDDVPSDWLALLPLSVHVPEPILVTLSRPLV